MRTPRPDPVRLARTALRGGLTEAETTFMINYRRMEELIELLRTNNVNRARDLAFLVKDDLGRVGRRLKDRYKHHDV